MAKRIARVILAFILLVGLLAAGALVFVSSDYGSGWISKKFHEGVRRQTGLEVTFQKVDLEFFPPRLLLEKLKINGVDLDVTCVVEEAEVSPDALDLLAGQISIEEIYMGAPDCRVSLHHDDMARFREASRIGDDESERIDLSFLPRFDVVALSGGHFELNVDEPGGIGEVGLVLSGLYLDITGRHTEEDQIEIRVLLERAVGRYHEGDVDINEQVEGLKLRAALNEDALNIRTFTGKIAEVSLETRDMFVPMNFTGNQLTAAFLSVDTPLNRLSRFPVPLPELKGHVAFAGEAGLAFSAQGKPAITAKGELKLRGIEVSDFVIGDLDGTVDYSKERMEWKGVELRTAGGALRLDGKLTFDDVLTIESNVELDRIELAKLLENLTVDNSYVMQEMTGSAKVSGTLNDLRLKGTTRLHVKNHQVFDDSYRKARKNTILAISDLTVQGPFTITEKGLVGNGFTVRKNDSLTNVNMTFAFDKATGWSLQSHSKKMNLADVGVVSGFTVGGTGSLDCRIDAPGYGAPIIDATADFNDMMFSGYDYRHVSSKVRFDGKVLSFNDLNIRSRKSRYRTARLALDFYSPAGLSIDTVFDVERAELEDLAKSYHLDISDFGNPKGYVSGKVDIRYQTQPENLRVETVLSHEGLTLFNEVFGGGEMNALYDDGILTVNRFDMTKGKGNLSISGTLGMKNELNFTGVATGVRIEDIVYPMVSDLELNGIGNAYVVVEGTVDAPRGEATLELSRMSRHQMKFGSSKLDLSLDKNVLQIFGMLADRKVTLEHSVFDFNADTFLLEGFVTDLDVAGVLGLKVPGQQVAVDATGEIAISGKMSKNPHLNGDGRIFSLSGQYNRFKLANKAPFEFVIHDGQVSMENARFLGKNVVFDLGGSASIDRLKLSARGLSNLKVVPTLVDGVSESGGTLSFKTILSGPWADLKFRGEAEVSEANFVVNGFPHPIDDVSGKLELGSNMIRIENFKGKTAGGTLNMSGWIALNGLTVDDYRFDLDAANLELHLLDDLVLKASTQKGGLVMVPGTLRDIPFVTGDVEISNFKYTAPVHIVELSDLDVAGISGKRKRTTRPRVFDKSKDSFEYDVRLHGERNLVILNNLLDARLKIDDEEEQLRLVGTNQTYGFLGRIVGVGGEVRFAGKTFEIQNAYLSFKDPNRPENPNFRVTADVDVRDWKVTITAEGTVEDYTVRLSSQPFLSQEDIVILLLTGMIKQEHTAMNSQGLAMSLAPLLENVGSGTIPVELNVYSEYSEKAEAETTRVALGKRISEDIWVQVSSSVGQEQDVEGTMSYEINDNVSVSAGYDNKNETSKTGNWGLDLRFRLEF